MLTLALPSKGRLMELAVETFAAAGVTIARNGAGREYAATIEGVDNVRPVMLSAAEIPAALAAGHAHLGVTGEDLIRETIPDADARVAVVRRLGFGRADLVVAVPAVWVDVETLHDLDEAAAAFRARHGRPMRVATKYHELARRFLTAAGVADYRLVDSQGATEAAPANGTADLIVDITSSGETLRANHLKVLADGVVLRSEALLCAARAAPWDAGARATLQELARRLGAPPPAV